MYERCLSIVACGFFFFFKQKTAYEMRISDWSSDVCSSDLLARPMRRRVEQGAAHRRAGQAQPEQMQRRGPAFSLTIDRVEFLAIDAQILRLAEELFGFGRRKTPIVGTQYQRLIVDDQPCAADLRQRAAAAEDRDIVGQVLGQ